MTRRPEHGNESDTTIGAHGPDSTPMKTLITANIDDENLDRLQDDLGFDVEYRPIEERMARYPPDELVELLEGVEVFIVGFEGVSAEILDAADDLKIIACTRGGPDANVDIEAATERGIPVLYAPGRNAVSVADFTLGLILGVARHIAHSHHLLHTGVYTGQPKADSASGGEREDVTWGVAKDSPYAKLKGPELADKTLGIVGMGAIGRKVAERAAGFEMEILGFDPFIDADGMAEYGVEKVTELDTVLQESNFVTLHVPVTDETRGMLGADEFATMGEDAYFINTARGALVDQDALLAELEADGLAGAALDVYDQEPLPADHPLLKLENVVTTPHLGGAAEEVIDRHSTMIVDDTIALLNGTEPTNVANPETIEAEPIER
jgi:D-3-phosphoglycerate dehydrogenase